MDIGFDVGVIAFRDDSALERFHGQRLGLRAADFVGKDAGLAGVVPAFDRRQFVKREELERWVALDGLLLGLVPELEEAPGCSTGPLEKVNGGIWGLVCGRCAAAHDVLFC